MTRRRAYQFFEIVAFDSTGASVSWDRSWPDGRYRSRNWIDCRRFRKTTRVALGLARQGYRVEVERLRVPKAGFRHRVVTGAWVVAPGGTTLVRQVL